MKRSNNKFTRKIHTYEKTIGNTEFAIPITMSFDGTTATFFCDANASEGKTPYCIKHKAESLSELIAYIDAQLVDIAPIAWESFIQVSIESVNAVNDNKKGNSPFHAEKQHTKTNIQIQSEFIEIGTDLQGNKWERAGRGVHKNWITSFHDESGRRKSDGWRDEKVTAYIPDTEANREMLASLVAKFDVLTELFYEAFMPENIIKFLSQNTQFQLTSGDQK